LHFEHGGVSVMNVERARVTLFYSDVSGFSALTERLGDARAFAVMSDFIALLRALAVEHGGHEVEVRGDACLLTFASADAALDYAVAVQRALAARRRVDPEHTVALRIGLHAGNPIAHAEGYFGRDVIVAARLADACPTNGILVSRAFQRKLSDPSRIGRERRVQLKGLEEPEPVARMYWGARLDRRRASRGPLERVGAWFARALEGR
jgi:class 3 adenylate cyclase